MTTSAKRKGTKFEKLVASLFGSIPGARVRRQPGSGIYQDFPHDVYLQLGEEGYTIECKHWKFGWRTGDKAIGQADFLVIQRNYGEPMVYLKASLLHRILSQTHQDALGDDISQNQYLGKGDADKAS